MIISKFIVVSALHLLIHHIKMSSANNYILIGTRIMKHGIKPESKAQGSGHGDD